MATKSGIITAINGFITSVVDITKHRNSMLELVNELWQTSNIQLVQSGTNLFWCNLTYKKVGNLVFLSGSITNKFTIAKNGVTMITIPNAQYFGKTSNDTVCVVPTTDGSLIQISISETGIYLIGNLAPNQQLRLNIHYQTND